MSPQTGPDRVIARRLRALADALPSAFDGEATAVHKARVASRRVREALPVLLAQAPAKRARKLRRAFERVTRALGPLREADVTLDLARHLAAETPDSATALGVVSAAIEHDRIGLHGHMLAELDDVDFETLVERIGLAMHEGPQDVDGGPAFHTAMTATLVIRAARRTRQLRAAVSAAGEDYAPAPLHAVRIAVKKLRYALELAHELKVLPSQRAITQLKGAQEMLGTMHDMQVLSERLVRTIAALPADAPVDTARALDRVRTLLDTRSREQHARYLLVRSRLVTASESVLDTLTAALPPLGEGESAPMTVH